MEKQRQQHDGLDPWNPVESLRQGYNWFLLLAFIAAVPVQILMRKAGTCGRRYVSWHHYVGVACPFLVAGLFPQYPVEPSVCLSVLCAGMLIVHKTAKKPEGRRIHSLYCGDSPFGSGKLAYTTFEPAVLAIIGFCFVALSPTLGFYMVVSAIGSSFFHSHLEARDNARVRAMTDAAIEQEYVMDQFKKEREE